MANESSGPHEVEVTHKIVSPAGAIRRIAGLGGIHDGQTWSMTADDIIAEVRKSTFTRRWTFYVGDGDEKAYLTVGRRRGKEYLKTTQDADIERTLLALPALPGS